jgi:hypothetical protein
LTPVTRWWKRPDASPPAGRRKEQEAQEARLGHDGFGEQLTGGWTGLRLADDGDPETSPGVTSIITCGGLCQMLIRAVWPSMVHSSVQWVASK